MSKKEHPLKEAAELRSRVTMYTNLKKEKGMKLEGPFFQNSSRGDHAISRPDHRGAVRVPSGSFVEGKYFRRFQFLKSVEDIPDGSHLAFSESLFEAAKTPVALAEPLPEPVDNFKESLKPDVTPEKASEEGSEGSEESGEDSDPSETPEIIPEPKKKPKKDKKVKKTGE